MRPLAAILLFAAYAFVAIPLAWAFMKWAYEVVGKFWGLW